MIRIALLSGPRNISTAMMRAFENRSDTIVFDEPFYAYYLNKSGEQHPMRSAIMASQPNDWDGVVEQLSKPMPNDIKFSFEKHIAFHLAETISLDFFISRRIIILIRNPADMIVSYEKKYENVAPIIESFRIQQQIYREANANKREPIIVDARDILSAPEAMLKLICKKIGMTFSQDMLHWPAGPRKTDGVWASHWYEKVQSSTGFIPYSDKVPQVPTSLKHLEQRCLSEYSWLYQKRLCV